MCDCEGRHVLRDSLGRFRRHTTPWLATATRERDEYLAYLAAEYLAAELATRGHLLSPAGLARGVRSWAWHSLRPPRTRRYASPELVDWLTLHPVLPRAAYVAQVHERAA
jgi:hypothetical protein